MATTTYLRRDIFGNITGVGGPNLTPLLAMAGDTNKVLRAQITGGEVEYLGESAELDGVPTAIENSSSPFHVLTANGVTRLTTANSPVIVDTFAFKSGGGKWLALFGSNNLATPTERGGVHVIHKTTGVVLASITGLCNDSRFAVALTSEGFLWVVDGVTARIYAVTVNVTTGVLTLIGSCPAPNCRDIVKVVLDPDNGNLFVVCSTRIVRFTVPIAAVTDTDDLVPTFMEDYGTTTTALYHDFVVLEEDKYWVGQNSPEAASPLEEYYGPMFGTWFAAGGDNGQLLVAAPKGSLWTLNDVTPYYTTVTLPPTVPPIVYPPVIAPNPPVITSLLTASGMSGVAFSYTITATGQAAITFSVVSPPSWLTGINALTGVISGTPPDQGTFNVTIKATNAGGTDTEVLVVTVTAAIADMSLVGHNGTTYDMVKVGNLLYVVGYFTEVYDSAGTHARNGNGCLNLTTGLWESWDPVMGAVTRTVASDGTWIYLGGEFTSVNATARNYLARVHPTTAALDSWNPDANSQVRGFMTDGADIWACGWFTTMGGSDHEFIAKFTASSGALSSWRGIHAQMPAFPDRYLVGNGANSVNVLVDRGSSILCLGGAAIFRDDTPYVLAYGKQFVVLDKTSGEPSQCATANISEQQLTCAAELGGVIYSGGDFGVTYISTFVAPPTNETLTGPYSPVLQQALSGTTMLTTFAPVFNAGDSNAINSLVVSGSELVIAGNFTELNGNSAIEGIAKITTTGATVGGFASAWSVAGTQVYKGLVISGDIVCAGGYFGGPGQTWNGQYAQGIVFFDGVTGARL